jgi:hypothetical protein
MQIKYFWTCELSNKSVSLLWKFGSLELRDAIGILEVICVGL